MKIEEIEFNEYSNLAALELFSNGDYARSFGKIEIENNLYKFSWRSDIMHPELSKVNSNYIVVGIDNFLVVFNYKTSEVLVKLVLHWNFMQTITSIANKIFVLTELSVYIFSTSDFSLENYKIFSEVIDEVIVSKSEVQIKLADGNALRFN